MKIFYDTEFLENGSTIELISIAMVAEDGRELYLVNYDAPLPAIAQHPWLSQHVVPTLPVARTSDGVLIWNTLHPDWPQVQQRRSIASQVEDFVVENTPEPELWAWYGAYDHVVTCQLFGRMIDLPTGFPMWTNDLKQEVTRLGNPPLPKQQEGEHNALADARWVRDSYAWVRGWAANPTLKFPAEGIVQAGDVV